MFAGMAVFDTMRYVKSDVSTVCVGLAASMGAFILASGHKVVTLSCNTQHIHSAATPDSIVASEMLTCLHHYNPCIYPLGCMCPICNQAQ